MSEREMIEAAVARHGFTVKSWDPSHENGLTAMLGHFIVTEGDEDHGLYDGDTGTLDACVVGAAEYGNQRVSFSFVPEGCDSGADVDDLSAVEELTS